MPKLYLGIDPGVSGGLALIGEVRPKVFPMPDTEQGIYHRIRSIGLGVPAVIEEIVPNLFGAAKSSVCKLYGNYLACRMALVACGVRFEAVKPKVWQSHFGLKKAKGTDSTRWKNLLMQEAQSRFPITHVDLRVSDALLLAEYCRQMREED